MERKDVEVLNVDNSQSRHRDNSNWIVDSGATWHMTSKVEKLDEINVADENVGKKVYLTNGQTTLVTHSGRCVVSDGGMLENVLVVP